MFDAMKFNGDKMVTGDQFLCRSICEEILGIYPVKLQYGDNGDEEFIVSGDESTGRLIVFRNEDGETEAMYIENSVETNQLVDLL